LADNQLCGLDRWGAGTYTAEGITKLCEGLKGSAVTSLGCAAAPKRSLSCQRPLTPRAHLYFGSVDGCALQIDELRGTKPTEKIDLSNKRLGVASAIIIASCIKENGVLKELKCAAAPRVSVCFCVSAR